MGETVPKTKPTIPSGAGNDCPCYPPGLTPKYMGLDVSGIENCFAEGLYYYTKDIIDTFILEQYLVLGACFWRYNFITSPYTIYLQYGIIWAGNSQIWIWLVAESQSFYLFRSIVAGTCNMKTLWPNDLVSCAGLPKRAGKNGQVIIIPGEIP